MRKQRVPADFVTAPAELEARTEEATAHDPHLRAEADSVPKTKEARNEHADRGKGSDEADAALSAARGTSSARKLIVFDFDRTIMKEHMWNKYRDTPITKIRITDDLFVDLPKFRGLVLSLKHNGHNVAVATFGRRDVVDKALHHALGDPHGISVRTPADFGHRDGSGRLGDKNTQLAELARRYCVAADQIIFLDDDPHNIEAAARAGVVHSQWVPDGLTKTDVLRVAEQVGVRPLSANEASRQVEKLKAKAKEPRRCGRRDTGPLVDLDPEEFEAMCNLTAQKEEGKLTEMGAKSAEASPSGATAAEAQKTPSSDGSPSNKSSTRLTGMRAPRKEQTPARRQ